VNPAYRSDVDGLRALAVIAVIVFHANAAVLSGGFAGVDIFFVISGFLISGQIARDVERGRFTFTQFYTRRIKRILPVYAVVSLSVSIASLCLLSTSDLVYFTTSLSASRLFASNLFFALFSSGYFDPRFELFPLLHTWSLGVEEQFYFAFPLLFVLLLRHQRSRATGISAALLIVFVAISELNASRPSSYYLIQYRAHELLFGMLSFLAIQSRPVNRISTANALCGLGFALIGAALRAICIRAAATWFFFLPALLFVSFGVLSYRTGGMPQRFSPEIREMMSSYSREPDLSRTCARRYTDRADVGLEQLAEHCAFGDMSRPKAEILLFGDSHASHFRPFLDVLAQQSHRRALYHVMGSCAPSVLPGTAKSGDGQDQSPCEQHNTNMLRLAGNFRFVALAGEWSAAPDGLEAGLSRAVDEIERAGAAAVLFRDSPGSERDISQCVLYKARGWLPGAADCNIPLGTVRRTQAAENGVMDRIKARHPDMIVIDPGEVMCNVAGCSTQIGNLAVYRDRNHINEKAARAIAFEYLALKGNPLRRPGSTL